MKTLIIIAGPNGAGKSTTSAAHLEQFGITAFDFDKEYYSKWAQFDFDPLVNQGVRDSTADLFIELQYKAIKENKSFSFETNFNNAALLLPHIAAQSYYFHRLDESRTWEKQRAGNLT